MHSNQLSIDGNNNLVIQSGDGNHIYINSDEDIQQLLTEQADKIDEILQLLKAQPSPVSQQWADKIYNIQQAGVVNFNLYGRKKIPKNLNAPPSYLKEFLGREQDLQAIHDQFFEKKECLILLNGVGGIGKTTFAAKYYLHYQSKYTHVGWLLSDPSIEAALLRLTDPLGLEFENTTPPEERMEMIFQAVSELPAPVLLVLDNTNDLENLEANYQNLRRLHNVHLLLTTRINKLAQASVYRIGSLSLDHAKTLFNRYYLRHQESEDLLFEQIYYAVDGNTLVIELLAKNLQQFNSLRVNYSLASLLTDLQTRGLLAINGKEVRTDYALQKAKPEEIISAMYDLRHLEPAEKRLLSNFAILPVEAIPFERLERLLSTTIDLDQLLTALAQEGWLDFNEEDISFKMSPVVQEIVQQQNQYSLTADCHELIGSLIDQLKWEDPGHYPDYQLAAKLVDYASSIIASFKEHENDIALLYERVGMFHLVTGNLSAALYYFEYYQQIEERLFSKDSQNVDYKNNLAISYQMLGKVQSDLGGFSQALNHFSKSEELLKDLYTLYPQNTPYKKGLAIVYQDLGQTHRELNMLKEALTYYQQSNAILKELCETYPEDRSYKSNLALSYQFLGNIYARGGKDELPQALSFFEQSNALAKEISEADRENAKHKKRLAVSYSKLGEIHVALYSFDQALAYFDQSSVLSKELYEAYPQNTSYQNRLADSYVKLGMIYLLRQDHKAAQDAYDSFYQLCQKLYAQAPKNIIIYANYLKSLAVSAALKQLQGENALVDLASTHKLFEEMQQRSKSDYYAQKSALIDQMQKPDADLRALIIELSKF